MRLNQSVLLLCVVNLCFINGPVTAQTATPNSKSFLTNRHDVGKFEFVTDNDAFFGDTDAQYTNGIRFSWYFSPSTSKWRGTFERLFENPGQYYWIFSAGHEIYTPSDINPADWNDWLANDFPKDRPYSGLLYVAPGLELYWDNPWRPWIFRHWPGILMPALAVPYLDFASSDPVTMARFDLVIGKAGNGSFAGPIQRNWHSLLRDIRESSNPVNPVGWDSAGVEIDAAFALNFNTTVERDILNWSTANRDSSNWAKPSFYRYAKPGVKLTSLTSVRLGTVNIDYGIGSTLKLGWMGSLPLDGTNATLDGQNSARHPFVYGGNNSGSAFYIYGTGFLRFVAYNRHIDNDLFGTEAPDADKRYVVFDFNTGFVMRYRPLELRFKMTFRSLETRDSPFNGNWHRFGQFVLSAVY